MLCSPLLDYPFRLKCYKILKLKAALKLHRYNISPVILCNQFTLFFFFNLEISWQCNRILKLFSCKKWKRDPHNNFPRGLYIIPED